MAGEAWLVIEDWGEWSDHGTAVESVWDSEAGAVSHIVRDLGAELDDCSRTFGYTWRLADDEDIYDTLYSVKHMAVRHGG